jgi:predicted DNA-binding antitoxin AbrB/MazE fold protein
MQHSGINGIKNFAIIQVAVLILIWKETSMTQSMTPLVVEAIYEKGALKLVNPLPLKENEKVRVTIEPELTWAERTAGMVPWTGDPEVLRSIIEDDEFSILEAYDHDELFRCVNQTSNPSSQFAQEDND